MGGHVVRASRPHIALPLVLLLGSCEPTTAPVEGESPPGNDLTADGGRQSDGGSTPSDGGARGDGGSPSDAGAAAPDASTLDGGASLDGGGTPDGGGALDGGGTTDGGGTGGDGGSGSDAGAYSDAGASDAGTSPDGGAIAVNLAIEGFGAGTLGGWQAGSTSYVVTTLADDGPGSLREGCRTQSVPRVVTFALDGRIALSSPIDLPSNITLDGRGRDVGVTGKGFRVHGQSHVILTHLAIEDVGPNTEDGIQIGSPNQPVAHHVVLDHLLFSQTGNGGDSANVDEAISVVFGAHDITVSWCHFKSWEKVLLAGNGDADATVDGQISVTLHHNWFEDTGRRHPRARYGRFDVFNNFVDRWHAYDWFYLPPYRDSYGAWCQSNCQMRVEANAYERVSGPKDLGTNADDASRCTEGGAIAESGAFVTPASTASLHFSAGCPTGATVFARPYAATVEPADLALVAKLRAQTGN